jgi:hypothetical protein
MNTSEALFVFNSSRSYSEVVNRSVGNKTLPEHVVESLG